MLPPFLLLFAACASGAVTKDTSVLPDPSAEGGEAGSEAAGAGKVSKGGSTSSGKGGMSPEGGGGQGGATTAGGAAGGGGASAGAAGAAGGGGKTASAGGSGKGGAGGGGNSGKGGAGGGGKGSASGKGGGAGEQGSGGNPGMISGSVSKPSPSGPECDTEGKPGTCASGLVCRIYGPSEGRCEGCSPCNAVGMPCDASVRCAITAQCVAGTCHELCQLTKPCATADTVCTDVGNDHAGVCAPP